MLEFKILFLGCNASGVSSLVDSYRGNHLYVRDYSLSCLLSRRGEHALTQFLPQFDRDQEDPTKKKVEMHGETCLLEFMDLTERVCPVILCLLQCVSQSLLTFL